jgi:hypothetical protein
MSDKLTADHYIAECLVKSAHVILGARVYQAEKPPVDKRAGKWVCQNIELCKSAALKMSDCPETFMNNCFKVSPPVRLQRIRMRCNAVPAYNPAASNTGSYT